MEEETLAESVQKLVSIALSKAPLLEKKEYHRLSAKVLKEIAFQLNLDGPFDIETRTYVNSLGDTSLSSNGINITFCCYPSNSMKPDRDFWYKGTSGRKDYSGVAKYIKWKDLLNFEDCMEKFRAAIKEKKAGISKNSFDNCYTGCYG